MINIKAKKIENENPWDISVENRIDDLKKAYNDKKKIVISIYNKGDNSTFRYRGYNVMKSSIKSNKWFNMYFFENEVEEIMELITYSEFVVFIRCMWSLNLSKVIDEVKKQNKKIIVDIDDYVCDINQISLVLNTLNQNLNNNHDLNFWFSYAARHELIASKADGFIVTNNYLGEKLRKKFSKPFATIINSLNQEQIDMSSYCVSEKKIKKKDKDFVLGYFSGSPSHINDFNSISNEIIILLEKYSNMKLLIVGYLELPYKFKKYADEGRILLHPFVNFADLQRLMAQVNINIVPLINNEFTNCKSELKFFEAAIVKTITVASPIYSYENSIKHGITGFLANQGEWVDIISGIYDNSYNTVEIIENAYAYCLENYYGDKFLKNIELVYDSILEWK